MNKIDNEEYKEYLSNSKYMSTMQCACNNFRGNLSEDEIYSCQLIGLWKTMQNWKPNGKSFKSFLYQNVRWQCLQFLKDNKPFLPIISDPTISYSSLASDLMDELGPYYEDIVHKKYFDNMTLREIGEEYGYCYETIRQHLNDAINDMKTAYYQN